MSAKLQKRSRWLKITCYCLLVQRLCGFLQHENCKWGNARAKWRFTQPTTSRMRLSEKCSPNGEENQKSILRFYGPIVPAKEMFISEIQKQYPDVVDIQVQEVVNVVGAEDGRRCFFPAAALAAMERLFRAAREAPQLEVHSHQNGRYLPAEEYEAWVVEAGPRPGTVSPWGAHAAALLAAAGVVAPAAAAAAAAAGGGEVGGGGGGVRAERSSRYRVVYRRRGAAPDPALFHDRMLETVGFWGEHQSENTRKDRDFSKPIKSVLETPGAAPRRRPEPVRTLPVLAEGAAALRAFSLEMGLGLDDWALGFYTRLFREVLKRDPTDVELFDLGQSNSEHCRHWFFNGEITVNGDPLPSSLLDRVRGTLAARKKTRAAAGQEDNSVIAFEDNSSGIKGFPIKVMKPKVPTESSQFVTETEVQHIILTAETHNFPSGVAPFPGAETGVGGRLRDVQATGRGGTTLAGIAGYAVGDLEEKEAYPKLMAKPVDILIKASNGASDYANKFGEPLVAGFARSYGGRDLSLTGRRVEWVKPIMFSAGVGAVADRHLRKARPAPGMRVVKVGGPAYRIGLGGGAASSRGTDRGGGGEGEDDHSDGELDLRAVQRGDAQMGNKLARVVRACCELGEEGGGTPVLSIHDQGAGGNANVLKELVAPVGATIGSDLFPLGDPTLSALELWASEYQENHGLLTTEEGYAIMEKICNRENLPIAAVGTVEDTGRITLIHSEQGKTFKAVDLPLAEVLEVPRRQYALRSPPPPQEEPTPAAAGVEEEECGGGGGERETGGLGKAAAAAAAAGEAEEAGGGCLSFFPEGMGRVPDDANRALAEVLKLVSVGSKSFLTSKVDRSVGGKVAAQPCVGPYHLPVGNVGVTALAWAREDEGLGAAGEERGPPGAAVAVGERPLVSLVSPAAAARLAVAEALTNLVWAPWTALEDVTASANWMWAAGQEGAALCGAVEAACATMEALGIAIDGGKDSLSMAVEVPAPDGGGDETVAGPGTLVVSAYVGCPDVSTVVTPDLCVPTNEEGEDGILFLMPLGGGAAAGAAAAGAGAAAAALGGSALAQAYGLRGGAPPDLRAPDAFRRGLEGARRALARGLVAAGHDVSEGGAAAALVEMAAAGGLGVRADLPPPPAAGRGGGGGARYWAPALFGEDPALLLEVAPRHRAAFLEILQEEGAEAIAIGRSTRRPWIRISVGGQPAVEGPTARWRRRWERGSLRLERRQTAPAAVLQEARTAPGRRGKGAPLPRWRVPFAPPAGGGGGPVARRPAPPRGARRPRAAVLREEGTNGDRELAAALHAAGFEVWDVASLDLQAWAEAATAAEAEGRPAPPSPLAPSGGPPVRCLAFAGGFSFADTLGSGRGWAARLRNNKKIWSELQEFRKRSDTYSIGICNGCQLMMELDWLESTQEDQSGHPKTSDLSLEDHGWPKMEENLSGRFESRFCTVSVGSTNSVFFKGMEGLTMGIWVANREGRFSMSSNTLQALNKKNLAPLKYVDSETMQPTESYPANPSGTMDGVAALASTCGRHLALMPHPERCFLEWQLPWRPSQSRPVPTGQKLELHGGLSSMEGEDKQSLWFDLQHGASHTRVGSNQQQLQSKGTTQQNEGGTDSDEIYVLSPWSKLFQNVFELCCSEDHTTD